MESFNGDIRESNNDGFEVIYKVLIHFYSFINKIFLLNNLG